jgi:hypothetical protein
VVLDGLVNVWRHWLAGEPTSGLVLWTLPVLWWGRIGKMLEFTAVAAVVLDLVGPDRLRTWGRQLRQPVFRKVEDWGLLEVVGLVITIGLIIEYHAYYNKAGQWLVVHIFNFYQRLPAEAYWIAGALSATFLTLALAVLPWRRHDWAIQFFKVSTFISAIPFFVAYQVALWKFFLSWSHGYILVPLTYTTVLLILIVPLYIIDLLIVNPISWLLDRERPGQPVRWLSVVLFIMGFHFDLLAS